MYILIEINRQSLLPWEIFSFLPAIDLALIVGNLCTNGENKSVQRPLYCNDRRDLREPSVYPIGDFSAYR